MLHRDGFFRRPYFVPERSFCCVAAGGDGLVRSSPQRPPYSEFPLALWTSHSQDQAAHLWHGEWD
jgi:hypothetical protein